MSDVGVEVGQKMRSAIKAKLTELECYVDDELPDYIMVMIANKRTKSQMKDDLQLFLSTKTSTFVDWLHIVLKKLKEVHVTNPDVFKKPVKRKTNDIVLSESDLKKVKKEKKEEARALKKARKEAKASKELQKCLTDDLPITANKLSEARKIVVMKENQILESQVPEASIDEDHFDIPLLSEISASNEEELEMIEKKIKNVKSRLGLHIESDDEDFLNIKPDPDDLLLNEQLKKSSEKPKHNNQDRKIIIEHTKPVEVSKEIEMEAEEDEMKTVHSRITYDKEKDSINAKYAAILGRHKEEQMKKKSILDRLGKRPASFRESIVSKKIKPVDGNDSSRNTDGNRNNDGNRISEKSREDIRQHLNNRDRERKQENKPERPKEGILSRLGVMSKVSIPPKLAKTPEVELNEEEERKMTMKEVPSVVKIKPRSLPPKTRQANPSLLFKAVAEAQRSVSQVPSIRPSSPTALFTKNYKEKIEQKFVRKAKLVEEEKIKLKQLITNTIVVQQEFSEDETEIEPVQKDLSQLNIKYNQNTNLDNGSINQQFIVTLDGIERTKFGCSNEEPKSIVKTKRMPSPIVFDKLTDTKMSSIPDKLPAVHPPGALIKSKERCKYWPGCRHGDKCEFYHPTTACKMFPNCKFEDNCLYLHPTCKFESSCTRRDCPYSHTGKNISRIQITPTPTNIQKSVSQICKFFPNCNNPHCPFYHPRLCKFGVFCKNQSECNFIHSIPSKPTNLTWRSDHK